MKKIVIYTFSVFALCLIIPLVFVNSFEKPQTTMVKPIEEVSSISDYNYRQYDTIKLLHSKTNEIEELKLDEYLYRCSIC